MPTITQKPHIECSVSVNYTEAEARALHALSEYGADHILKVLDEKISSYLVKHHGPALKSIFDASRDQLAGVIDRTDKARKVFTGECVAVPKSGIAS